MTEQRVKPGEARSPGPSVQDLMGRENNPVPEPLLQESYRYRGSERIAKERYYAQEFHDLEMERMWSRTWQMACREEEIETVGDTVIYEIGDQSLIVIRSSPDEIKALRNVCLHRGRLLRDEGGNTSLLQCKFHAWSWNLDGSLNRVPCDWDFSCVTEDDYALPEVLVDTWGGFVFVNFDADAIPLEQYLAPIPEHFKDWALEDCFIAAHVGREVEANWKVTMEAFIESYHVLGTHPQLLTSIGDTNTQYDSYPDRPHMNRMITPMAVSSPHLGDDVSEQRVADAILGRRPGAEEGDLPEGMSAREYAGGVMRDVLGRSSRDVSKATDSEMLDAIEYYAFPNFFPWGGYGQNIIYRFRPVANDPGRCLMEAYLLRPVPESGDRPDPAPFNMLKSEQPWTDAPELGMLGSVFEQNWVNIPFVQRGLRAMSVAGPTLGDYQESRIRDIHNTLDLYIEGDPEGILRT